MVFAFFVFLETWPYRSGMLTRQEGRFFCDNAGRSFYFQWGERSEYRVFRRNCSTKSLCQISYSFRACRQSFFLMKVNILALYVAKFERSFNPFQYEVGHLSLAISLSCLLLVKLEKFRSNFRVWNFPQKLWIVLRNCLENLSMLFHGIPTFNDQKK